MRHGREAVDKSENRPIRDVHHPRKHFNKMCSRGTGFRCAIIKGVNLFEGLVIFCLESGIVIQDRHCRRSRTSLKMLFPSFWVAQKRRSRKDCLFEENRMIVAYDGFCEPFTCSTTSAAASANDEIVSVFAYQGSKPHTGPHTARMQ